MLSTYYCVNQQTPGNSRKPRELTGDAGDYAYSTSHKTQATTADDITGWQQGGNQVLASLAGEK